jgi:hypothetical protein
LFYFFALLFSFIRKVLKLVRNDAMALSQF